MAQFILKLLGGFEVRRGTGQLVDLPARKAQALLAFLALPPGQVHLREKLAALLWSDSPSAQARANLRHALFDLRRALDGSDALRLDQDDAVALSPEAIAVDVATFERRLAEATPSALEEAAAIYAGDLLAGLRLQDAPFEEWLLAERERLHERAIEGLARLLAHQRAAGTPEAAIGTGLRLLALDPLQEAIHRTLMRLYAGLGRRGAALRQYRLCVDSLQRELRVDPEVETKELYQEILRRRPVVRPVQAAEHGSLAISAEHMAPPLAIGEIPLVGREPELSALRQSLRAAWGGRPRLLALVGEAGIGKSRLVAELAAAAPEGAVVVGRGFETDQILSFGPWIDAFRMGQLAQDHDIVGQLVPAHRTALARLLPEIAPPGPAGESPDSLQLFEGVAGLIGRLAARRPLLVVLEDLHWADEMSVRLLAFVSRRLRAEPVLVLITLRAEELPATAFLRHTLDDLRRASLLTVVSLSPLSRAATASLARQVDPGGRQRAFGPGFDEKIWLASRGNPFVIVETLRALAASPGTGDSPELPLPDGVRELVVRRLERLGEAGRRLVTVAAVIGREFDFPLVRQVADLGEEQAAEAVEELVRCRLLRGVGEGFELGHDRIRQVVYGRLLPPRRALLHRRVAEALEARRPTDAARQGAILGTHCLLGGMSDKAADYLEQAGATAAAEAAHRDAARCYEGALAALEQLPATAATRIRACDFLSRLGYSLGNSGAVEQALARHDAAVTLAETLDDPARLCSTLGGRASALTSMGRYVEGLAAGERALAIAKLSEDVRARFWLHISLARIHYALGNYEVGVKHARLGSSCLGVAAAVARSTAPRPDVPPSVVWRSWLVLNLSMLGAFGEAIAAGEEMVAPEEMGERPQAGVWAPATLGSLHLLRGDATQALSLLEPAVGLCRRAEIWVLFPRVAAWLGSAYTLAGRVAEGIALLEESVARARSSSVIYLLGDIERRLGEAYLAAGRTAEAEQILAGALRFARERQERGSEVDLLRVLGDLAQARAEPDLEAAAAHYRGAIALADQLGLRPIIARCLLALGRVCRRQGRSGDAQAALEQAVEQLRGMGMGFWLSQAEAELTAVG